MSQRLWFGAFGGVGIVGVLFVMGIILKITKVSEGLGSIALWSAVFIAVLMGFLGIAGISKKLSH